MIFDDLSELTITNVCQFLLWKFYILQKIVCKISLYECAFNYVFHVFSHIP